MHENLLSWSSGHMTGHMTYDNRSAFFSIKLHIWSWSSYLPTVNLINVFLIMDPTSSAPLLSFDHSNYRECYSKLFGIINVAAWWTFLSLCFSFIIIKGKVEKELKKKSSRPFMCSISLSAERFFQTLKINELPAVLYRPALALTFLNLFLCLRFSAGFWFAPTPTVQLTFTLRTTFIPTSKQAIHMPDLSGTHAGVTGGGPIRPHLDLRTMYAVQFILFYFLNNKHCQFHTLGKTSLLKKKISFIHLFLNAEHHRMVQ